MSDAAQEAPDDWANDATRVPALAGLCVAVAMLDLYVRRGVVRIVGDAFEHASRLGFEPYTRAIMNAVALTATIVTFDAMAVLLRHREAGSIARRLSMAVLMVSFLPCIGIALFLPAASTDFKMVLLASMLAHVFAAQLALGAFEHRGDPFIRGANLAVFGTSVGAVVSILFGTLGPRLGWAWSYEVSRTSRAIGELAWALAPVFALGALARRTPHFVKSARFAAVCVLGAFGALSFLKAKTLVGSDYAAVLYGALHAQTLAEGPGLPYALVVGCGVGAAAFGALSRDGINRQLGYAAALLLSAGYAPNAPMLLALLVAASALFARALYADAARASVPMQIADAAHAPAE